ncbi:MAG TPA: hypothetical protein VFO85_15715 [Vicinamibacteria bacterium]|nr:hypothetical protein [Vicinamibacteria bacterium]
MSARAVWGRWSAIQRGFFLLGLAQLAVAGGHALVALAQGGTLQGPVSIRKPVLFAESFGLVSLGFAFTFHDLGLPARLVGPLGWTSIALSGLEVALATLQFWRGVPSHFNYSTLLDGLIAGTMTSGAVAFALFLVLVTVLAWRRDLAAERAQRRSFVQGVRLSLPLALFGLAAVGLVMLLNGGHAWHGWTFLRESVQGFRLGRYNGQAPGLAGGGSLMTVHALGTHALQVLPLAGWWAGRGGAPERAWRRRLAVVAALYSLAMLAAAARAFAA